MRRILIGLVFLTVSCVSVSETATTEESFTSLCYKASGDSLARYPWEATFPLGGQHVFCNHQPTAFAPAYYAPNLSLCTPVGHETPGPYQVDVWLEDIATPKNYYCARVSLSGFNHYHVDYESLLELGWSSLQSASDPTKSRRVDGLSIGPGVGAQISGWSTVQHTIGCLSGDTLCNSAFIPPGSQAFWLNVGLFNGTEPVASVDFYRPPNW